MSDPVPELPPCSVCGEPLEEHRYPGKEGGPWPCEATGCPGFVVKQKYDPEKPDPPMPDPNDYLPTKHRLANALVDCDLPALADRARAGEFDDIESTHALPKSLLVAALAKEAQTDAIHELSREVIEGEFDNSASEFEDWMEEQGMQGL